MKKLYTTAEYKKLHKRRSLKSLRKRNEHKRKGFTKPINTIDGYTPRYNRYQPSYLPKPQNTITPIVAPDDFSIINNTEGTIEYFDKAYHQLKNHKRVLFDISKIQTLTTDAIAVQIAKITDENYHHHTTIIGNEPEKEDLRSLFVQSGFYDHVRIKGDKPINDNKLLIHKITNNKVEPDIAKKACLLGLKHTFQNEEIFEPLYDILIEVMQNTNNHAGTTRGTYDWWLHVYNHPHTRITSYTFLDLGVGIFNSLPVRNFKREFMEFMGWRSNLDLVPRLFAGEIKSRTSRPERGKGIPQIFECSHDRTFQKFILISNDVYANMKTQEYRLINNHFRGTLYYWELKNNNHAN